MLLHGDEIGRTQGGNNNTYCQDNDIAWVHWDLDPAGQQLLQFTRAVVKLRQDNPVFRRRRFFAGSADHGGESDLGDIAWFMPNGKHMDEQAWRNGLAKSVMVFLNGDAIPEPDKRGNRILGDSFLVIFNAHHEPLSFTLPEKAYGSQWLPEINTATPLVKARTLRPRRKIEVDARSVVVLRCPREVAQPPVHGVAEGATA
jgi:glycogen operon protein